MGTDDLHKKRSQERQDRRSKALKERAETWLFVCEGEKTEPNYFKGLINEANGKSANKLKYRVEGTGKNTESLVSGVDEFFRFADKLAGEVKIPYGRVFTVFDKDSFTPKQFNNAIETSMKKGYMPIWSNECIELWFLLHFDYIESNIPRSAYFTKLEKLFGCKYDKAEDHFKMLQEKTELKTAYHNAKRLYEKHKAESSYAKKVPCTTVFQLIDELERHLHIKL